MVDKLVEKLSENSDENIMTNVTLSDHKNVCGSCKVYIFFFSVLLTVRSGIGTVFIYFHWYSTNEGINSPTETTIY